MDSEDVLTQSIPLFSPLSTSDSVKMTTPTSPHLAVSDKKHTHQGTKTLFEILKKSPLTSPAQPRRIKLQLHIDKLPTTRNHGDTDPPPAQKRDLEDSSIPQSAAKRLCLEDTTNKKGGEENIPTNSTGPSLPLVQ